MFCCTLLYVHSSFAIILMGKRELVALLSLSSWCLVIVVWLFLVVPWVCLQFVIVVFSDHTHLLFFKHVKSDSSLEIYGNDYRGIRPSFNHYALQNGKNLHVLTILSSIGFIPVKSDSSWEIWRYISEVTVCVIQVSD